MQKRQLFSGRSARHGSINVSINVCPPPLRLRLQCCAASPGWRDDSFFRKALGYPAEKPGWRPTLVLTLRPPFAPMRSQRGGTGPERREPRALREPPGGFEEVNRPPLPCGSIRRSWAFAQSRLRRAAHCVCMRASHCGRFARLRAAYWSPVLRASA
jgi:hypothetical protein